MVKTVKRLMITTATLAVAMCFDLPIGWAFGDAPWCAVTEGGDGDVHWDCEYRSVEECAPNVIAGNRGFCNVNPYGPGPYTPKVVPRQHRIHRD